MRKSLLCLVLAGCASAVKSMDFEPESGVLAYVKAEEGPFAERVTFVGISRRAEFPGARLYKARWTPALD